LSQKGGYQIPQNGKSNGENEDKHRETIPVGFWNFEYFDLAQEISQVAEAAFAIPGLLVELLGQMPASPLQSWYCRRRGLQRMMRCQWSPERPNSLQRVLRWDWLAAACHFSVEP